MKTKGATPKSFLLGEEAPNPNDSPSRPNVITCESGMESDGQAKKQTPEGTPWVVRAGKFTFVITFQFAINKAHFQQINGEKVEYSQEAEIDQKLYDKIYSRPMELSRKTIQSAAKVVVEMTKPEPARPLPPIHALEETKREWKIKPIAKQVQTSLWGQCNSTHYVLIQMLKAAIDQESIDPAKAGNKASDLLDGKNVSTSLIMALSISPPEPYMPSLINKIAPFNVVEDMKQDVFDRDKTRKFPDTNSSSGAWLPTKESKTWEDVKAAWRRPGNNSVDAVNIWASRLKFKTKPTGAIPKNYIERLDQM
ncbi:MAG: hypothetical protein L6R41_004748, partial [Letrouitia leprolyta]